MATEHPKKAEAFLDLAAGATLGEVAEKYKVPKTTVQRWAAKVEERLGKKPADIRESKFDEKVQVAACALMDALASQAELVGDKTWLMSMTAREGGTRDVIQLTKATAERLTIIVQFAQGGPPDGAERPELPETVEAEIVE